MLKREIDRLRGQGAKLEVGEQGEQSWIYSPVGNMYSADGSTLYAQGNTGYEFVTGLDGEESVVAYTGAELKEKVESLGFQPTRIPLSNARPSDRNQ